MIFQNEDNLDFERRNLFCKVESFFDVLKTFKSSIDEKNSVDIEGLDNNHLVDSFWAFVKSLLNFIDRYVRQKCLTKKLRQKCLTKMFDKYVRQICSTNMFHKYVQQICSTNMFDKYV